MFISPPGTGVVEKAIELVRKEDHDVLPTVTISNILRAFGTLKLKIHN
jgi:hypothetical protein